MHRIVESAPAKINLGLKILGRRQDGYHNIVSVAADRGPVRPAGVHARGARENPDLLRPTRTYPPAAENLVYRAAEILRRETGAGHGVRVDLVKRIPAGRGPGRRQFQRGRDPARAGSALGIASES